MARHLHLLAVPAALIGALSPAVAQQPQPAAPPAATSALDAIIAADEKLGGDPWRGPKVQLSSRKHRDVTLTSQGRKIGALLVLPDRPGPAPVVIVVPEDQGLTRWGRDIADEIAAMGYVVVAPDFQYGLAPNGGGGSDFPDIRSAFLAHAKLPRDEAVLTAALNTWADWAKALPEANGKLAIVGFAWGGGRAAAFAAQRKDLAAAFIFYDAIPAGTPIEQISAPVYGFYAEHDARVIRSLPATEARMKAAGKRYESITYPGADHMFVRLGEEPRDDNPANILARHKSLARLQELLAAM